MNHLAHKALSACQLTFLGWILRGRSICSSAYFNGVFRKTFSARCFLFLGEHLMKSLPLWLLFTYKEGLLGREGAHRTSVYYVQIQWTKWMTALCFVPQSKRKRNWRNSCALCKRPPGLWVWRLPCSTHLPCPWPFRTFPSSILELKYSKCGGTEGLAKLHTAPSLELKMIWCDPCKEVGLGKGLGASFLIQHIITLKYYICCSGFLK